MKTSGAGVSLGLSLDQSIMTLVWRYDGDNSWHCVSTPSDATPDGIPDQLGQFASSAPASNRVTITLLRPLAHTRTVRLPRMARAALERVLSRDWMRHIIGVRTTEHTVSSAPADRGRWRASFAPTDLLVALSPAASDLGWNQIDIRTSDDSVAGALQALAPKDAQEDDLIAVVCDTTGPTHAFHLRRGAPWIGRRFLPNAGDDDVVTFASTHASKAPVVILGGGARAKALARTLGEQGRQIRRAHV